MKTNMNRRGYVVPGAALCVGMVSIGLCGNAANAGDYFGPLVTLDYNWSGGNGANYLLHEDSDEHWYDPETGAWVFQGGDNSSQGEGEPLWELGWSVWASDNGGSASSSTSEFVNANLSITNNTAMPQTFTALVTLALPKQFVGGTLMNGGVSAAVTDLGGDGATLTNSGADPIYRAYIDNAPWSGSPVQSLFDSGLVLSAGAFGTDSDDASFGDPVPIAGPEALNTISVYLVIELSAFDSANVVGTFQISQVPAPGVLPLLAGMALVCGGRRRRA